MLVRFTRMKQDKDGGWYGEVTWLDSEHVVSIQEADGLHNRSFISMTNSPVQFDEDGDTQTAGIEVTDTPDEAAARFNEVKKKLSK